MTHSFWLEDEFEVSANGFLLMKEPRGYLLDEEQPVLLHTTTVLLRSLYPLLDMNEIFLHSGYREEGAYNESRSKIVHESEVSSGNDNVIVPIPKTEEKSQNGETTLGTKQTAIPSKYQSYQKLERIENLSNQIQLALQDIRTFRHRTDGGRSDDSLEESVRVRALQYQQRRLLQLNPGKHPESVTKEEIPRNEKRLSRNSICYSVESKGHEEESIALTLARTLNSIRALFPHLLPILNHPRRNDKKLVIGKTRYKTRRNGPMCWLLGTKSFGSSTSKQSIAAQENVKWILEAFIGIERAVQLSKDPKGAPLFWPKLWLEHVTKRNTPNILSPIEVLAAKTGFSEEDFQVTAAHCDAIINGQDQLASDEIYEQYRKVVKRIHHRLSNVLTSRFPGARLSIYGSCLSNLSIGKGSDVDMSLWIPEADKLKRGFQDGSVHARQYEQSIKNLVYKVFRKLNNLKAEFRSMTPITKARIPVITGTYIYAHNPFTEDGSINFDICFLNDIAVANSSLLRDYSLVDPRVRQLMIAVKQWAKEHKINSAKDKCLSSYAWMNLVVFYLQCIGFLPNLQSHALMKAAGIVPDPARNYWHFIDNLDTCTLEWETVRSAELWTPPREFEKLPLSLLLYGFFEFYSSRFPFGIYAVSIKRASVSLPKLAARKANLFFSIEDPFETYDSHCPHDLGSPVNDYASKKIRNCISEAEDHVRKVLCSEKSHEGKLWPSPPFVEPEPTRRNAKKSGFRRFECPVPTARNTPVPHNFESDLRPMRRSRSHRTTASRNTRGGLSGNTDQESQNR